VGRAVVEAFGLDDGNVVVRLTEADPAHVYWGG
jgi:phenylpyruvate tautomerase PptA (4-oxalocrotonate tautomerase family)